MATLIQFWEADGPNGEALIIEFRCKVLEAVGRAATTRPARTVLVTLADTRNKMPLVYLWVKPGYTSGTTREGQEGLLNKWRRYI